MNLDNEYKTIFCLHKVCKEKKVPNKLSGTVSLLFPQNVLESKALSVPDQSTFFCCCSVAQSCPALCDSMNCSLPGFPILHYLPEFAQTHVYWVGDTIQPSHPLLFPSPALSLSQNQGLFQWTGSSHQVAEVLELQHVLPMNIQGWFPLGFTGLISLLSNGLSRTFSSIAFRKHRFFGTQVFMVQHWHLYMTTVKTIALTRWTFVAKVMSLLFNRLSKGSHTTELN